MSVFEEIRRPSKEEQQLAAVPYNALSTTLQELRIFIIFTPPSMKSLVAIFFITLFLAQGMAPGMDLCCELQKLPNLVEHYQQHKACNDNSIWQFLADHFINTENHPRDTDDTHHSDLPVHDCHQCCHPPVFHVTEVNFVMAAPEHIVQMKFHFHNSLHSSELPDSPFQPPRA